VAAAALRLVIDWAAARREEFFHLQAPAKDQPHGGWLGRWDRDGDTLPGSDRVSNWAFLGILPHVLEGVLRDHGFDYDSVVRTWRDREWIETDDGGRNTKRASVGGNLARVIALRRSTVEECFRDAGL